MASIFDRSLKGVYTPHRKNTKDIQTEVMPIPDIVYIVMSQHMGPPCEPMVKKGDEVKVGQVIGSTEAFLSAPIHSSVSGVVERIDEIIMPNGMRSKAVVIKTDKEQTLHPDLRPPVINNREDFLDAIKNSGMVGLGGAGFPTHVKFNPKNSSEIDTLIINAAECEPYITSDYRAMMEDRDRILNGIRIIMKYLSIPQCIIGIEDNKPEAIASMNEALKDDSAIRVKKLKSKYPQGAEKVLIYETTNRVVPEGKLPADVGAIVINVTTAASLDRYFQDGIPLIKKRITVDGDAVNQRKNVLVPIGTPISEVLAFCGGPSQEIRKVLMGGPMMGIAVYNMDYPILKNNNAVLFFAADQVEEYDESACIRCGRCARACPMNLMPLRIEDAFNKEDLEGLEEYKVSLCIECGCCAYACPAKRHLVQVNRLGKARLRAAAAAKK